MSDQQAFSILVERGLSFDLASGQSRWVWIAYIRQKGYSTAKLAVIEGDTAADCVRGCALWFDGLGKPLLLEDGA